MLRRNFLAITGAAAVSLYAQSPAAGKSKALYKQSAMTINFGMGMTLDEMCEKAAAIGIAGFDLIQPKDWPTLKKYGLLPTMYHNQDNTFADGIMHPQVHDALERSEHAAIDRAAANGVPNLIIVGGQQHGMSIAEGSDNCVAFLNRIKAHAEDKAVTIVLEPVNLIDRPDQLFHTTAIAFDICKRVNSPRVKVCYDIYHAQRTAGNVTEDIRNNFQWIGHVHTAGIPDRHEIDDSQELNYRFVARTLIELGYSGYVAHEYRPSPGRDPVKDLQQAMEIMGG